MSKKLFYPFAQSGLRWGWLAILVVLLDQITKMWMMSSLTEGQVIEVLPVFNLTLLYNPGAAFSFLAGAGGWQRWFFTGISVVASFFMFFWLYSISQRERLLGIVIALILGGALGNLVDRVLLGSVVDFLDFHWGIYHFPAFNVADSAITIGAFGMVLEMFLPRMTLTDQEP